MSVTIINITILSAQLSPLINITILSAAIMKFQLLTTVIMALSIGQASASPQTDAAQPVSPLDPVTEIQNIASTIGNIKSQLDSFIIFERPTEVLVR